MKGTLLTCRALILTLGLGACSDDNGESNDTGQDETTTDPVQDEVTTDIPAEDATPDLPAEPDVVVDTSPDPDAVDTPAEEIEPGEGEVGDPCTSVADCGDYPATARQCMTDLMGFITFEGGYCSATCTSATECGDGANCVNMMIVSYCLKECDSNSDCRMSEHYECGELPYVGDGNTYCIPQFDIPEFDM
jgi:hypothetical protein